MAASWFDRWWFEVDEPRMREAIEKGKRDMAEKLAREAADGTRRSGVLAESVKRKLYADAIVRQLSAAEFAATTPDPDTMYLVDWGSNRVMNERLPFQWPDLGRRRRERKRDVKHIRAWLLAEQSYLRAQLIERCDRQQAALAEGDLYGLYGEFPPATLD